MSTVLRAEDSQRGSGIGGESGTESNRGFEAGITRSSRYTNIRAMIETSTTSIHKSTIVRVVTGEITSSSDLKELRSRLRLSGEGSEEAYSVRAEHGSNRLITPGASHHSTALSSGDAGRCMTSGLAAAELSEAAFGLTDPPSRRYVPRQ